MKAAPLKPETEFAQAVTFKIGWSMERSGRADGHMVFEKIGGSDGGSYADSFGPFDGPAAALHFIDARRRAAIQLVEQFKRECVENLPAGGA